MKGKFNKTNIYQYVSIGLMIPSIGSLMLT